MKSNGQVDRLLFWFLLLPLVIALLCVAAQCQEASTTVLHDNGTQTVVSSHCSGNICEARSSTTCQDGYHLIDPRAVWNLKNWMGISCARNTDKWLKKHPTEMGYKYTPATVEEQHKDYCAVYPNAADCVGSIK